MTKHILTFLIAIIFYHSSATHIVGGSMHCQSVAGSKFLVSLSLYFDEMYGNSRAIRDSLEVGLFYKSDHRFTGSFFLKLKSKKMVNFTYPECDRGLQKTSILVYSDTIDLLKVNFNGNYYNGQADFYMVHEQCCRNGAISNIEFPLNSGMVFYCEHSPLSISGNTFVNSNPVFNTLGGEYICKNQPFRLKFDAYDADGDSLVYAIVPPLKGFTSINLTSAYYFSGPYPGVVWKYGYSYQNPFQNSNPMVINNDGLLVISATNTGLYAFAVSCTEYRNAKKIGAVFHEYQLHVRECPLKSTPSIMLSDAKKNVKHLDTVHLIASKRKCFKISATDTTAGSVLKFDNVQDKDFDNNWVKYEGVSSFTLLKGYDTVSTQVCFDGCYVPKKNNQVYSFHFFVSDNACPIRNIDSVSVYLKVTDTTAVPIIHTDFRPEQSIVEPGSQTSFNVWATDSDVGDRLTISIIPDSIKNFEFLKTENTVNTTWNVTCSDLFAPTKSLKYVATDANCITHSSDTLHINLSTASADTFLLKNIPNIITPNIDGYNDDFRIDKIYKFPCNASHIPVSVDIINRYGVLVYADNKLDFVWKAADIPDGVYFYRIMINNKTYKNWLQVLK